MQIGYVGLGKMGFNMVERLLEKKHEVVAFDPNKDVVNKAIELGVVGAESAADAVKKLKQPSLIWIMVPYKAVDAVLAEITPVLQKGDTVIDGGNSPYKESIRRAKELAEKGIEFLDAGVSGGPGGARNGACIMVGGQKKVFDKFENLFKDLTATPPTPPVRGETNGYGYMGKSGAGHFVKMVHNGIEYGIMQAIAEGFAVMKASDFKLDLTKITDVYNHASVIESKLVGWLKNAYEQYGEDLSEISGKISHSGEGLWTVDAAKELGIPLPIIEGALNFRIKSQGNPSYTGQVVSALRNQFGGHEVTKESL